MEYPIKIRSDRGHNIITALSSLFALGICIVVMSAIGKSEHREILYILCTILAGFMAVIAFHAGTLAYKNPVVAKFDKLGVLIVNNSLVKKRIEGLRVNWSDISSVEFFSSSFNHGWIWNDYNQFRYVTLILKDNTEIKHSSRKSVNLIYTGQGMGFSHHEYFEFVKSEFLKYQNNPPTPKPSRRPLGHNRRLFG